MKRQSTAQESAFQLPTQQMLFVLLAVLVTLLGVQQFQRWSPAQSQHLLQPQVRSVATEQLNPVSSHTTDRGFQPMQGMSAQALPDQPRWVF